MKPTLRYALHGLLWGAALCYVLFAGSQAHRRRANKCIDRLEIVVADSSSHGHLVTGSRVREWISRSGIATIGTAVDAVDLSGIERVIARNGFVDKAVAYVTYSGVLRITIRQRKPVVRLLTDGMNHYVTAQGHVFAAPASSSLYVPVITGSYQPPFEPEHTGDVRRSIDERKRKLDERIEELEREKYPLYERERKTDREYAEGRRAISRQMKRHGILLWKEPDSLYKLRRKQLQTQRKQLRRDYRYKLHRIDLQIESIARQQQEVVRQQKKLEKSYEDFMKLLTFVEYVEKDDFWRSEVVQITARTTPSGALEVDLTPRSGRFVVRFGRLERFDEKFDKLLRFYRGGLSRLGWDAYRSIDIRFDGQVVCRK